MVGVARRVLDWKEKERPDLALYTRDRESTKVVCQGPADDQARQGLHSGL